MNRPVIIGIAGGSGAGKTTIVRRVARALGEPNVTVLEHEWYYRNHARPRPGELPDFNFDHPRSFDTALLVEHVRALRDGQTVQAPIFDCALGARRAETTTLRPAPAILVEGILVLADEALRSLMDLKVFVDADADTRFIRRLEHDMARRGRTLSAVIDQYLTTVKPMHVEFVEPTRRHADLIVRGDGDIDDAVGAVVALIRTLGASV